MIPPLKRPTRRTEEVLYVRSPKSHTPSLWSSEISSVAGLFRDPKPAPLKKRALVAASYEVALLEAIAAYPGQNASFYAKKIKRPYQWTIQTLGDYELDGVVQSFSGRSREWRLT